MAVIGASGHLGANLVRVLLGDGLRVVSVDKSWRSTLDGLDVERVTADVLQPHTLDAALADVDAVINLAAVISVSGDPHGLVRAVNVDGATNVATACGERSLPLVHCSSVHAFDLSGTGPSGVLTEDSPFVGDGGAAYDRSKRDGAIAVQQLAHSGLDVVTVHPTGFLGPFDAEPSLAGQTLLSIARGRLPFTGPGGFDFVDVRDVAQGVLLALRHGLPGERYLLSGEWYAVAEMNSRAADIAGARAPIATMPMALVEALAPWAERAARVTGVRPIFTPESVATVRNGPRVDTTKASRHLGYEARPIDDTLADTFSWFRQTGMLKR